MERPAPVRKSHTSTADLLTWPEGAAQELAAGATPPPNRRPHQPSEAISKVVFGGQVTEEEFESLNKRKPCSAPLWKEMTGSGIFAAEGEVEEDESSNASATPIRTVSKNYQASTPPPESPSPCPQIVVGRSLSLPSQSPPPPIGGTKTSVYPCLRAPPLHAGETPLPGRPPSPTPPCGLSARACSSTHPSTPPRLSPPSRRRSPPVLPLMSQRLAVSRQAGSFSDVLRHCGRCYLKLSKASVGTVYKSIEVQ